jgi:hypothetical protein
MDNIINDIKRKSSDGRIEQEEGKLDIEMAIPEVQDKVKIPSYTIMTKKIRPRKIAIKEQEAVFQEMIKSGYNVKRDFMIELPGKLGKFINETLSQTIRSKHPIDIEAEERRGELARQREASIPTLPEFFEIEPPEHSTEELKELY